MDIEPEDGSFYVKQYINGLWIKIYEKPVKIGDDKDGKPFYESRVYIRKAAPNARDAYDQPIRDADKAEYRELWRQYTERETPELDGTPVEMVAFLDPAQVKNLKVHGFLTIESFATAPETSLHNLPAAYRDLQRKAREYVDSQDRIGERFKETLEKIEALELRMQEAEAHLAKLEAAKKTTRVKKPAATKESEAA